MCTYLVLLLDKTSAKFENKGQIQMDTSKWTNPNHASLESLPEWTDETMAVRSQRNLHNNTSKLTIPSVAA